MTIAEDIKKLIMELPSKELAIKFCRGISEYIDRTEGENDNYIDIFCFEDDSELRIDTENFVYCDTEKELEKHHFWD